MFCGPRASVIAIRLVVSAQSDTADDLADPLLQCETWTALDSFETSQTRPDGAGLDRSPPQGSVQLFSSASRVASVGDISFSNQLTRF